MTELLDEVANRISTVRDLRDNHGWPEVRSVADLRSDPRVLLRNHLDAPDGSKENLVLAAALILLVEEDRRTNRDKQ